MDSPHIHLSCPAISFFFGGGEENTRLQFMNPMNPYFSLFDYTKIKFFQNLCQDLNKNKNKNLPTANFSNITIKMTLVMRIYFNSIWLPKPENLTNMETTSNSFWYSCYFISMQFKSYPCWNFLTMPAEIAEGTAPTQLK